MAEAQLIMLAILILGTLARNPLLVSSSAILLVVQALDLRLVYRHIQTRGIDLGLILLLLAVMVPFAAGRVGVAEIRQTFTSVGGLAAVAGGILASAISAPGVALLKSRPEVIVGLVVGSILGVVFLRGIPVGPLAAAGFAAVLLRLIGQR